MLLREEKFTVSKFISYKLHISVMVMVCYGDGVCVGGGDDTECYENTVSWLTRYKLHNNYIILCVCVYYVRICTYMCMHVHVRTYVCVCVMMVMVILELHQTVFEHIGKALAILATLDHIFLSEATFQEHYTDTQLP